MAVGSTRTAARVTRRRRWRWLLAGAAVALVALLAAHARVLTSAAPFVCSLGDAPVCDAIVVPGARVHRDGRPSHMLADRLHAACELFLAGKAPRILLSGRGGGGADDEVAVMRSWLVRAGVPAAALVDDPLGLRTRATMQRARDVYGAQSVLVVSNPFHVARAVFLGRAHGLAAFGVAAAPQVAYSRSVWWRNELREMLARPWAWLEVSVGA